MQLYNLKSLKTAQYFKTLGGVSTSWYGRLLHRILERKNKAVVKDVGKLPIYINTMCSRNYTKDRELTIFKVYVSLLGLASKIRESHLTSELPVVMEVINNSNLT